MAAQMAAFYQNPEQMGIPHATVVQLVLEGRTLYSNWQTTFAVLVDVYLTLICDRWQSLECCESSMEYGYEELRNSVESIER